MRFQIAENCSVDLPFAQRPVIHAQHLGCFSNRGRRSSNQSQDSIPADRHSQSAGQSCARFGGGCEAHILQRRNQPVGFTSVAGGHARQGLGERLAKAVRMVTEESAQQQNQPNDLAMRRQVLKCPAITAVHPAGSLPAERTWAGLRDRRQRDNDLVWPDLKACGLECQRKQK